MTVSLFGPPYCATRWRICTLRGSSANTKKCACPQAHLPISRPACCAARSSHDGPAHCGRYSFVHPQTICRTVHYRLPEPCPRADTSLVSRPVWPKMPQCLPWFRRRWLGNPARVRWPRLHRRDNTIRRWQGRNCYRTYKTPPNNAERFTTSLLKERD